MVSRAVDDLTLAFLHIEKSNDSFPHISLVPKPDKTAEVADLFAESATKGEPDFPRDSRVVCTMRNGSSESPEQADDEYGDASWYELDDRLAYLKVRAPAGEHLKSDFTWAKWKRLLDAFGWHCAYCGSQDDLGQDHVVSISDGGQDMMSNILPSCKNCNRRKAHKLMSDWLRQCPIGTIDRIEAGRAKYGR